MIKDFEGLVRSKNDRPINQLPSNFEIGTFSRESSSSKQPAPWNEKFGASSNILALDNPIKILTPLKEENENDELLEGRRRHGSLGPSLLEEGGGHLVNIILQPNEAGHQSPMVQEEMSAIEELNEDASIKNLKYPVPSDLSKIKRKSMVSEQHTHQESPQDWFNQPYDAPTMDLRGKIANLQIETDGHLNHTMLPDIGIARSVLTDEQLGLEDKFKTNTTGFKVSRMHSHSPQSQLGTFNESSQFHLTGLPFKHHAKDSAIKVDPPIETTMEATAAHSSALKMKSKFSTQKSSSKLKASLSLSKQESGKLRQRLFVISSKQNYHEPASRQAKDSRYPTVSPGASSKQLRMMKDQHPSSLHIKLPGHIGTPTYTLKGGNHQRGVNDSLGARVPRSRQPFVSP